jgi:hypothetical protein
METTGDYLHTRTMHPVPLKEHSIVEGRFVTVLSECG